MFSTEIIENGIQVTYYFKDTDIDGFLPKLSETFSARITAQEVEKRISPIEIENSL